MPAITPTPSFTSPSNQCNTNSWAYPNPGSSKTHIPSSRPSPWMTFRQHISILKSTLSETWAQMSTTTTNLCSPFTPLRNRPNPSFSTRPRQPQSLFGGLEQAVSHVLCVVVPSRLGGRIQPAYQTRLFIILRQQLLEFLKQPHLLSTNGTKSEESSMAANEQRNRPIRFDTTSRPPSVHEPYKNRSSRRGRRITQLPPPIPTRVSSLGQTQMKAIYPRGRNTGIQGDVFRYPHYDLDTRIGLTPSRRLRSVNHVVDLGQVQGKR